MRPERHPRKPTHLDDESDRGDVSKEGFGDYDKEFHPAEVDTGEKETNDDESSAAVMPNTERPGERGRRRAEVHFRTLNIRNRGAGMGGRIASW